MKKSYCVLKISTHNHTSCLAHHFWPWPQQKGGNPDSDSIYLFCLHSPWEALPDALRSTWFYICLSDGLRYNKLFLFQLLNFVWWLWVVINLFYKKPRGWCRQIQSRAKLTKFGPVCLSFRIIYPLQCTRKHINSVCCLLMSVLSSRASAKNKVSKTKLVQK